MSGLDIQPEESENYPASKNWFKVARYYKNYTIFFRDLNMNLRTYGSVVKVYHRKLIYMGSILAEC